MTSFPSRDMMRANTQKARQNEAMHRAMVNRQAEAFRAKLREKLK